MTEGMEGAREKTKVAGATTLHGTTVLESSTEKGCHLSITLDKTDFCVEDLRTIGDRLHVSSTTKFEFLELAMIMFIKIVNIRRNLIEKLINFVRHHLGTWVDYKKVERRGFMGFYAG